MYRTRWDYMGAVVCSVACLLIQRTVVRAVLWEPTHLYNDMPGKRGRPKKKQDEVDEEGVRLSSRASNRRQKKIISYDEESPKVTKKARVARNSVLKDANDNEVTEAPSKLPKKEKISKRKIKTEPTETKELKTKIKANEMTIKPKGSIRKMKKKENKICDKKKTSAEDGDSKTTEYDTEYNSPNEEEKEGEETSRGKTEVVSLTRSPRRGSTPDVSVNLEATFTVESPSVEKDSVFEVPSKDSWESNFTRDDKNDANFNHEDTKNASSMHKDTHDTIVTSRDAQETVVTNKDKQETIVTSRDAQETVVTNKDTQETVVTNKDTQETIVTSRDAQETVVTNKDTQEIVVTNKDTQETIVTSRDAQETVVTNKDTQETIVTSREAQETVVTNRDTQNNKSTCKSTCKSTQDIEKRIETWDDSAAQEDTRGTQECARSIRDTQKDKRLTYVSENNTQIICQENADTLAKTVDLKSASEQNDCLRPVLEKLDGLMKMMTDLSTENKELRDAVGHVRTNCLIRPSEGRVAGDDETTPPSTESSDSANQTIPTPQGDAQTQTTENYHTDTSRDELTGVQNERDILWTKCQSQTKIIRDLQNDLYTTRGDFSKDKVKYQATLVSVLTTLSDPRLYSNVVARLSRENLSLDELCTLVSEASTKHSRDDSSKADDLRRCDDLAPKDSRRGSDGTPESVELVEVKLESRSPPGN